MGTGPRAADVRAAERTLALQLRRTFRAAAKLAAIYRRLASSQGLDDAELGEEIGNIEGIGAACREIAHRLYPVRET